MKINKFIWPIRVYYEDTDAGGVVYHARYVAFCERGRSDFLRLLGIHQSSFADVNFVVRRMVCDFHKPARLDDLLEVLAGLFGEESIADLLEILSSRARLEQVPFITAAGLIFAASM